MRAGNARRVIDANHQCVQQHCGRKCAFEERVGGGFNVVIVFVDRVFVFGYVVLLFQRGGSFESDVASQEIVWRRSWWGRRQQQRKFELRANGDSATRDADQDATDANGVGTIGGEQIDAVGFIDENGSATGKVR